ncbi:hypothetical protein S245_062848, partial [Arachis hypogaea]
VIGARIVAVGRAEELALEKENKSAMDVTKLSLALKEKERTIAELSADLSEEKRLRLSSAEEVKAAKVENDRLGLRIKELQAEVYEAFAQGFERAASQVRVLFPESDVDKLDATKVVVGGQLVDDEAAAADEGEGSSIGDKIE